MLKYLLSSILILPLFGVIPQLVNMRGRNIFSIILSLLSTCLVVTAIFFLRESQGVPLIESHPWIETYAIRYSLGLSGFNVSALLMVSIIFPVLIASEWKNAISARGIISLLLLLQFSSLGVVLSDDMFLLFFFWGLTSLPLFFLIGIWGSKNKEVAAFRFILTQSLGNIFVFSAILLIYFSLSPASFEFKHSPITAIAGKQLTMFGYDIDMSHLIFYFLFFGLAMRMPIWPIHGWFVQISKEVNATMLIILSAVQLPLAVYIFAKFNLYIVPDFFKSVSPYVIVIGGISVLMGTVGAVAQRNFKALFSYLGLVEVGWLLMGLASLNSAGIVGSIFELMVFGVAMTGFGLVIGLFEKNNLGSNFADENSNVLIKGIVHQSPYFTVFTGLVFVSLLGFPGVGGFVGKSLLMIGNLSVSPLIAVVTLFSGAWFCYLIFSMYKNVFFGKLNEETKENQFLLGGVEAGYLIPIAVLLVVFGLAPSTLIDLIRDTTTTILEVMK